MKRLMQWSVVASLAVLLVLSPPPVASGANPNPGVAPLKSRTHGKSYSEWAQAWWEWAVSIPADQNPVLDETGEFAGVGQTDRVFFLAGTLFGGTFEREVTVPAGTSLFFPALNALFWAPDDLDDAAFFAEQAGLNPALMTDEELIRFVVGLAVDDPALLKVTVDGKELKGLEGYRAASDAFELTDTDLIDTLGGEISHPNLAVADGYWVMLHPLPPGQHTIRIQSAIDRGSVRRHGVGRDVPPDGAGREAVAVGRAVARKRWRPVHGADRGPVHVARLAQRPEIPSTAHLLESHRMKGAIKCVPACERPRPPEFSHQLV